MISLTFFTIGSLLCALAPNENMLILFRVFQGLGGGSLFPLATAISFQAFSTSERAAASALVGIPVLIAPAFGPTIGGLLTDKLGWEYIFFINVPVGFIALFLAWRIFDKDKVKESRGAGNFDFLGLILIILGTITVVYAFTLVSQSKPGSETAINPRGDLYGWSYWLVWTLLGVGLLILALFALYELKVSKDPVLDLHVYGRYEFSVASVVTWFSAALIFGSLLLLPIFLEQVRLPHLGAMDAGLALMPQGLAAAVAVALGGRLYNLLGVRKLVMTGSILLVISSWQLSNLTPTSDGMDMMPWLILRGLGFGLTGIPVQTLALESIKGPALAKASSLFNVTRQIFSSIGVAVLLTLFSQQTVSHSTELAKQAMASLPVGTTLDPNSPAAIAARETLVAKAGTAGITDVFNFVTYGTLVLLAIAFMLPGKRSSGTAEQREPVAVME